jgi:propanediol dehydratase small subunit
MSFDPASDYPLGSRRPDLVVTAGGTPVANVSLAALRDGTVDTDDLRATPETLRRQAAIAEAAGNRELSANLVRAAELASIPDDVLLEVYTALRPHRSSGEELDAWADRLESEYGAVATAVFVREARTAYDERGFLNQSRVEAL